MLILGLGNEILSDDGIGPRLVRIWPKKIREKILSLQLLLWRSRNYGIYPGLWKSNNNWCNLTKNGKPGNVVLFYSVWFQWDFQLSNLHDVNFLYCTSLGNIWTKSPYDLILLRWNYRRQGIQWKTYSILEKRYPEYLQKCLPWLTGLLTGNMSDLLVYRNFYYFIKWFHVTIRNNIYFWI